MIIILALDPVEESVLAACSHTDTYVLILFHEFSYYLAHLIKLIIIQLITCHNGLKK